MLPTSRPGRVAALSLLALVLVGAPLWAILTPADVADIAPAGAPDGKVDAADVQLALRVIAGDATLDAVAVERADCGPVAPLSPASVVPQRVRPNPVPLGPVDIGDAVVIARRAAGLIVFDEVNQAPTVTVQGNGDVVSIARYTLRGRMTDDTPVDGTYVEVTGGAGPTQTMLLTPDPTNAKAGDFTGEIVLAPGKNTIAVRGRDVDLRWGAPTTISVTLDQTGPTLTITSPDEGFVTRANTVELSGTVSDPSGATVSIGASDAILLPPDLWGATAGLPAENENVVSVTAKDGARPPNVTTVTRVIVRDTTPPVLLPDAPAAAVSTKTLAVTGEVRDAWGIDTVTVGGETATITWDSAAKKGRFLALVPVLAGANQWDVVAVDKAGNRTTAGPLKVTGDFDPPTVTLTSPAYVRASPTTIGVDFSEPVFVELVGSRTFTPATRVDTTSWTLAGVTLTNGLNLVPIRIRDLAGNVTNDVLRITLDTVAPTITITKVSNAAFKWIPANGLDNVMTNAPSALVEGTVSDNVGVATVKINGFDATVKADGTFSLPGLPFVPRLNNVVATATDLAGNTANSSITVRRDVEGPVVALDFSRAAYVSAVNPAPSPFDVNPVPKRMYRSTSDIVVNGTATDATYTGRTETLVVKLDGTPLTVTGSAPFSAFSFTLPVATLRTAGLHLLEVESTDSLGNQTLDVQSMLDGQWVVPNGTIANAAGLVAGADALSAMQPLIEQQVEAMNGDIADVTQSLAGAVTMTIYGIAFCRPSGDPARPPYDCTPNVKVTLGLTSTGHLKITIAIPTLYAGISTSMGIIFCNYSRDGYIVGSPTTISLEADFVNTATGVQLQPIQSTVNVVIGSLDVQTHHGCAQPLIDVAGALLGGLQTIVANVFKQQITPLLDGVNSVLAKPLITDAQTGRSLTIARASNDATSLRFWLDGKGNPCPTSTAKTNISDGNGGYKPCPADSPRVAPGSYATPNTTATTLPNLDLVAPDGTAVSTEMAANDDFVNYMVHEQWAMGTFDMTIDQSFLGAGSPISLDTDALSIFMPDLKRSDVVAKVPLGSKVAIQTGMMLPPVLSGRQTTVPNYDLAVGDMTWKFMADADGKASNGYETPLFTASVTLKAAAQLAIVPGATDNKDDQVQVTLGTPTLSTDIVDNPLILNENSVRGAISTLVGVALPQLTGSLTNVSLPANTARFSAARMEAPAKDFLVLSGSLLQTITVTKPVANVGVTTDPVLVEGTVDGLVNSAGSSVQIWLDNDTTGRNATILTRPDGNSLTFRYSLPLSALAVGENKVRVVARDSNGKKANLVVKMTRVAGTVTAASSSGCGGCDGTGGGGAGILLLGMLLFMLRTRRAPQAAGTKLYSMAWPLLAAALAGGMADCESCSGCGEVPPDGPQFHGAALQKDPAFLISKLQIGTEEQGFNVDENSPDGDPYPDNALQVLGPLANESLAGAVEKGQILLLVQFPGLTNLPAAGEEGTVNAVAFLGVDTDGDATDNFSGSEAFAKSPSSFDEAGNPLIVFHDVKLAADANGVVTMHGGPATFKLSIPLQGSMLSLQISPTFVDATLGVSALRADGLEASSGLLGGVLPAGPMATPIEGLPFAPLSILASEIDVDLNGDGKLDHTATLENQDGLSAGLVFEAVPAYLTDDHVNRPPTITLDAVPDQSFTPKITITGTVKDPDDDCANHTVDVTVNGNNPVRGKLALTDDVCRLTAEVKLVVGRNAIKATVKDPSEDAASAEVVTNLEDHVKPKLVLEKPTGRVLAAEQTVTGVATDDIGLVAVQLEIAGELVVVPADKIDANGRFSATVTLPAFGHNVITGIAKDVGDNLSEPSVLDVTLADVDAPTVTFTAASCEARRTDADGPWTMPQGDVVIEGHVADNVNIAGVSAEWRVVGETASAVTIDPETGEFRIELHRGLGTYTIHYEATDTSGNRTTVERVLTIDDEVGPAVVVESPEALVRTATQQLVLRVSDDWGAPQDLVVKAGVRGETPTTVPYDAASGTFRRPLVMVVGTNPLAITATDPAGNVTRISGDLELVDEEPPALTVTAPDDATWTVLTKTRVTGTATDNIGPVRIVVDVDGVVTEGVPGPGGSFALDVDLRMGANSLTISAIDAAGLTTQAVRRVERKDPDAVATVDLATDFASVAAGNDTAVTLTATLTRLAGGPVPDGTVVAFEAAPGGLGTLASPTATTTGGVAKVKFTAGRTAGLVAFTASAQGVSATASLTIAIPNAVAVDVCLAKDAKLAGASFELGTVANPPFVLSAPGTAATKGLGAAQAFHTYNRAALPTMALVAGTSEITGVAGGNPFARLTWPLKSGFVAKTDLVLKTVTGSDEKGATFDASGVVSVCAVDHQLGKLPPRVTLGALPATSAVATVTVTGTIESTDLAHCTGVLSVNGTNTPIDVTSGTISTTVTLAAGTNTIRLTVTDADSLSGIAERQVRYTPANAAPQIAITAPGTAVTSTSNVLVEGTVSDSDDGLAGLTVAVRVGTAAPVSATIDAAAGTWRATVNLQSGTNTIAATATDARGATTVVTQSTQVVAAIVPPRITLTAPTDGLITITPTVTLAGRVDDGGNPATIKVTLTVNGAPQTITFSPFTRDLSATISLQAGTNVIVVTATDITSQSAVATRRVDYNTPDAPPKVTITSPVTGSTWGTRTLTVKGTVKDDRSLLLLKSMKVNGVAATVDTTAGTWTATITLTPGNKTITAEAIDGKDQSGTASITVRVFDPIMVVNYLQIGGPSDGFNVDSTPPHPLSDAAPDNALSGLAAVANGPLQQQIDGTSGKPLILLFELIGLQQLPNAGQSVTVAINGYLGTDGDNDPSDNFSGAESFTLDPASFDLAGNPVIRFNSVTITNSFGVLKFDTFPANPAHFQLTVDSTTPPLVLKMDPAYIRGTLTLGTDGLRMNPGLLGGVVPASALTVPISAGTLNIVPLQLLISSDPANPVPDVDLNGDGTVNTTDATSTNPDGVSVGIVTTAVPAGITR